MDVIARIVPPLARTLYKGQCGKVGIFGGCFEYTGAPFYAAMAALRGVSVSRAPDVLPARPEATRAGSGPGVRVLCTRSGGSY